MLTYYSRLCYDSCIVATLLLPELSNSNKIQSVYTLNCLDFASGQNDNNIPYINCDENEITECRMHTRIRPMIGALICIFARDWEAGPSDWLADPHGSAGVGKAGLPQDQSSLRS